MRDAGLVIRGSRSSTWKMRAPEAVARWAALEHVAERPHRGDQDQQVRVEGGELAERERAVDHLAAADEQDQRQADVRQEADQRAV